MYSHIHRINLSENETQELYTEALEENGIQPAFKRVDYYIWERQCSSLDIAILDTWTGVTNTHIFSYTLNISVHP